MSKEHKHKKGDAVFYNNNPAEFVAHLSDKISVVMVQAYPNLDSVDGEQWCAPCNIGGGAESGSHTCDQYDEVIDVLRDDSKPTIIPLMVDTAMIYKKPLEVMKHDDQIAKLDKQKAKLNLSIEGLEQVNSVLETRSDELRSAVDGANSILAGLSATISAHGNVCLELKDAANNHFYATKNESLRSVIGCNEDIEIVVDGKTYLAHIQGYWEKHDYFYLTVTGKGFGFYYSETID